MVAAFKLGIRRSAATSSKKVGRVDPSPPSATKDMVCCCVLVAGDALQSCFARAEEQLPGSGSCRLLSRSFFVLNMPA